MPNIRGPDSARRITRSRSERRFCTGDESRVHSFCRRNVVCPPPKPRGVSLPQPVNDAFIEAIVERIRAVVSRQSAGALEAFARTLNVSPDGFRAFVAEYDRPHRRPVSHRRRCSIRA
jgi:hypothetical protein